MLANHGGSPSGRFTSPDLVPGLEFVLLPLRVLGRLDTGGVGFDVEVLRGCGVDPAFLAGEGGSVEVWRLAGGRCVDMDTGGVSSLTVLLIDSRRGYAIPLPFSSPQFVDLTRLTG
jgi:hypothetical protein